MSRFGIYLALAVIFLSVPPARALTIQFDYTYDTNSFFSGANVSRRTTLNAAAQVFSSTLTDNLSAITPSGNNTWQEIFLNPSGTNTITVTGSNLAANTVVIYVGAQSLGGELGAAEYGFTNVGFNNPQSWSDIVEGRGQAGALTNPKTDFALWGGSMSFDLNAAWYFDSDPSTVADLPANNFDFYSAAVHELGHMFGFGTAGSWSNHVSNGFFLGSHAEALNGGNPVALSGGDHWAQGTMSTVYGINTPQEVSMEPGISAGGRRYFTTLDFAGLQDVGWQVSAPVPEPSSAVLLGLFGSALFLVKRKCALAGTRA